MRYIALVLVALATILFNGCDSGGDRFQGNNPFGEGDATSPFTSDAASGSDASGDSLATNDTVTPSCKVDPSVNGRVYVCNKMEETKITAIAQPDFCGYDATNWSASVEKTVVENAGKRVRTTVGVHEIDCVEKGEE